LAAVGTNAQSGFKGVVDALHDNFPNLETELKKWKELLLGDETTGTVGLLTAIDNFLKAGSSKDTGSDTPDVDPGVED
jgi:hypothetical protein